MMGAALTKGTKVRVRLHDGTAREGYISRDQQVGQSFVFWRDYYSHNEHAARPEDITCLR